MSEESGGGLFGGMAIWEEKDLRGRKRKRQYEREQNREGEKEMTFYCLHSL